MKHFSLTILSFATATLLTAMPSQGAVVVQDTHAALDAVALSDFGGGVYGYEINLNPVTEFSAAGHSKLILAYSHHDGVAGNTPAHPTVTSVTYNGVALTQAVYGIDNSILVSAGIFYLDNVVTDGTLRIELNANNVAHYSIGLYAVDGLAAGAPDTGTGRTATDLTTTLPVTIGTSEGFFVQEAARNNQSFAETVDDYTTLYNYSVDSFRAYSQYRVTDSSGNYVAPIGNTGENFRRVVAAGFEAAIPEPSSLALLGLGGLLIARRRRG